MEKNFLWAPRLWIGRRYNTISGNIAKKLQEVWRVTGSNGLIIVHQTNLYANSDKIE